MPDRETFMAGVALAFELLDEAKRADAAGTSLLQARYRDGAPQATLLAPVLRRLAERPELLAGFDAMMTDVIGAAASGGSVNLEMYARFTYDEIMDPTPEPDDEPVSNVVQLRAAG